MSRQQPIQKNATGCPHKSWKIFKLGFKTYEYEILKNSLTINICIGYILVLYNFCLKMVSIDL